MNVKTPQYTTFAMKKNKLVRRENRNNKKESAARLYFVI